MTGWLYYFGGEYSHDPPRISVYDAGFLQGVTVSEQLRTFGGRVYRWGDHLARLRRSLEIVGVDCPVSWRELEEIVFQIADVNRSQVSPGNDLSLTLFVTPGTASSLRAPVSCGPVLCVHAQPIAFADWCHKYVRGQRLVVTSVRQTSPRNWPPELKCRSRMHYYLADRQARGVDPDARALLLDLDGFVCEASTANVFHYVLGQGCIAPRRTNILPGVSLDVLRELCEKVGLPFTERDVTPDEFMAADEAFLCSTSPCLLPVVAVNGQPIGHGGPGDIFRQLLVAWNEEVGIDIAQQARDFALRL